MQVVINISDMEYNQIKAGFDVKIPSKFTLSVLEAVKNGTPLPKGHGRLIDANELNKCIVDRITMPYVPINKIQDVPTIIEADRSVEE